MLYDYVSFTDSHKIRKIAKISWLGESGSVLIYNKNLHDTTYSDEIFVNSKNIHPIELTRDILTANGFKTQYVEDIDTDAYTCDNFPFVIEVVFRPISENNIDKEKRFSICLLCKEEGNPDPMHEIFSIKYVHELQNVLRMCNIDKEIIL